MENLIFTEIYKGVEYFLSSLILKPKSFLFC